MTDDRDPNLQRLFAEAEQDLNDSAFTANVMAKTRQLTRRQKAAWRGAALLALITVWIFSGSLQGVGQLIAQELSMQLVSLNNQWLAWALLPVNNLACLLLLVGLAVMFAREKINSVAY